MTQTDAPRRPWWRKKRWVAAGLLWLPIAYALSYGPASYAVGRGWLGGGVRAAYAPLVAAADALRPRPIYGCDVIDDGSIVTVVAPDPDPPPRVVGAVAQGYVDYVEWFRGLGERHARRGR